VGTERGRVRTAAIGPLLAPETVTAGVTGRTADMARALTGLSTVICELHALGARHADDPELGQRLTGLADRIGVLSGEVLRYASLTDRPAVM
jgi:hypothetical protein